MSIKWHRRDYELVANVIAETCSPNNERLLGEEPYSKQGQHQRMIAKNVASDMLMRFADKFADDNPRFNRGKFEQACNKTILIID